MNRSREEITSRVGTAVPVMVATLAVYGFIALALLSLFL
jgi:hypothetical protein